MAEDLTVQLDDDTRLALSILTDGASVTAAVRRALITAAGAG